MHVVNRLVARFGVEIVPQDELWLLRAIKQRYIPIHGTSAAPGVLPEDAAAYLSQDNPRVLELRARYDRFPSAVRHSLWTPESSAKMDLRWFRGDNPYIWQYQDWNAEVAYVITAYYLQSHDPLDLLHVLSEDGRFGVHTFSFNDEMLLSRDLLDSINEITFLETELGVSRWSSSVLDIGAGYGRLVSRLAEACPNLRRVLATDAVAESTFLSEFYVRFRGLTDRAEVVPFDEIERRLQTEPIDCAINVHSFSETTHSSVCWWLDLLVQHRVRHLMIVPNAASNPGDTLLTRELEGAPPVDYSRSLHERGYRLVTKRPKYTASSVQKLGVSPTHYYLFELT